MFSMDTNTQLRLDIHEEQIQLLQSGVKEIKAILKVWEEDRAEEREFRKIMLNWIQQQEQQPLDITSTLSDSPCKSQFPLDLVVLDEISHDCNNTPPSQYVDENVVAGVVFELESVFKTVHPLIPLKLPLLLPHPLPLRQFEDQSGRTMSLLSIQGGMEEKNPNSWIVATAISSTTRDSHGYLAMYLRNKPPPTPLPPPLLPLLAGIEDEDGVTYTIDFLCADNKSKLPDSHGFNSPIRNATSPFDTIKEQEYANAMSYFFKKVLLSEPIFSTSDWRIPIVLLVSCVIIDHWNPIDG